MLRLALLALAAPATAQLTCSSGWFWSGASRECKRCPAGKFQPLPGALECVSCAPGTYQHLEAQIECKTNTCRAGHVPSGGVGGAACTACPPGRAAARGEAKCRKCEALEGRYAFGEGAAVCLASTCPEGHFQTATGCIPCVANTYQPQTGQPHCFPCPKGHTAAAGAARCAGGAAQWVAPIVSRCQHTTCQYNGHHVRVEHNDPPPPVENPLNPAEVFFRARDATYTRAVFRATMLGPLGAAWKALSAEQKAAYVKLAAADRVRYEGEIRKFRKNHHCFWRTLSMAQQEARCCLHEGLSATECFHRKQSGRDGKQGHCHHNGRAPFNHAHGECICLCYADPEVGL